ncbi:hypothetical protein [Scale drop disease virus]|uniref:Uncharacterized protein n=1 Tax=Scale drop disease virus TaxID=1697349 RepID=A0A7D5UL35_9VIRU|nr:hypothetical protein [Scale drop disease virus]QXJ13582.1 ORF005L [Scale drop disease virus]
MSLPKVHTGVVAEPCMWSKEIDLTSITEMPVYDETHVNVSSFELPPMISKDNVLNQCPSSLKSMVFDKDNTIVSTDDADLSDVRLTRSPNEYIVSEPDKLLSFPQPHFKYLAGSIDVFREKSDNSLIASYLDEQFHYFQKVIREIENNVKLTIQNHVYSEFNAHVNASAAVTEAELKARQQTFKENIVQYKAQTETFIKQFLQYVTDHYNNTSGNLSEVFKQKQATLSRDLSTLYNNIEEKLSKKVFANVTVPYENKAYVESSSNELKSYSDNLQVNHNVLYKSKEAEINTVQDEINNLLTAVLASKNTIENTVNTAETNSTNRTFIDKYNQLNNDYDGTCIKDENVAQAVIKADAAKLQGNYNWYRGTINVAYYTKSIIYRDIMGDDLNYEIYSLEMPLKQGFKYLCTMSGLFVYVFTKHNNVTSSSRIFTYQIIDITATYSGKTVPIVTEKRNVKNNGVNMYVFALWTYPDAEDVDAIFKVVVKPRNHDETKPYKVAKIDDFYGQGNNFFSIMAI